MPPSIVGSRLRRAASSSGPGEQPGRTRLARARSALLLAVYLALGALVFRGFGLVPGTYTLAKGHGEGAFFLWVLRWTPYAVGHGLNPFVTGYLNAPVGVNLMWNTSLPLPGLVMAPVTLLLGPVVTYDALLVLGLGLSAWTAYLAIRRYVSSRVAAALGGLVYGFSPYMRAHSLGHVNLTLVFLPPLLLLLLDNVIVRQRRTPLRDGALLGLVAACQLLINEEVLATTALAGALLVVVLAAGHRHQVRSHLPYAARAMAVAGLVFVVLAAVPLANQFFGPYRYSGPPGTGHTRFVNDLDSFVVPGQQQLLTTAASVRLANSLPGNLAERTGYLGAPLLLLALGVAVRWWSRPVVRAAALLALFMAVLSMGAHLSVGGHRTTIPLPWSVLGGLPLVEGVIPARLAVYTALFVGLLLAVFADAVMGWGGWRRLLGAAVVLLALAPIVPRYTNSGIGAVDPPRFFTGDGIDRVPVGSVALVLPFPDRSASFPMMWHAMGGIRFKMPGGYFLGPDREGHARFGPLPSATRRVAVLLSTGRSTPERLQRRYCAAVEGELRSWGVRTVLVGPMAHQAEAASFFSGLFGRAPRDIGEVLVWQDVEPGGRCP
jgi:Glycosyltransferase family 87